jgi:hypothetical protein
MLPLRGQPIEGARSVNGVALFLCREGCFGSTEA